jgi:hypothetical protein
MAEAEQIIATSPHRRCSLATVCPVQNLNDSQKQNEPKSTTSALQISSAK